LSAASTSWSTGALASSRAMVFEQSFFDYRGAFLFFASNSINLCQNTFFDY
jgi:hypothetical protein